MGRNVIVVYPGDIFHGIKIIRELEPRRYKNCTKRWVEYECPTCGSPSTNDLSAVVKGKIKQCITCAKPPIIVNAGDRYGDRVIVRELEPQYTVIKGKKYIRRMVECECDRGHLTTVSLSQLVHRDKKDGCGKCKREDADVKRCDEYWVWLGMRTRCYCKSSENYLNYGGRGIKICERWDNFENFLSDMGRRPTSEHTIERIDNDKDYSPDNCRWATTAEQNRNKRGVIIISHKGETMCLAEWGRKAKVAPWKIYDLMKKHKNNYLDVFAELGLF